MVNVAILGFGVVGSGVAEVLDTNERHIEGKVDDLIRLNIFRMCGISQTAPLQARWCTIFP